MITINFVLSIDDFLYSIEPNIQTNSLENLDNYAIDNIDFENNSILSLLNYYQYNNSNDIVFISNGYRVVEIAKILNELSDVNFHVFTHKLEHVYGDKNILNSIKYWIIKNIDFEMFLEKYKWYNPSLLLHSVSGLYPLHFKSYLIKHLFLNNFSYKFLNISLIYNISLNGLIISNKLESSPFINITHNRYNELISSFKIGKFSNSKYFQYLNLFSKSGHIHNPEKINTLEDINLIINDIRLNKLYINDKGISLDSKSNYMITRDTSSSFEELINYLSLKFKKHTHYMYKSFYYIELLNISAHIAGDNFEFITPFNSYFLEYTLESFKSFDLIGIKHDNKQFIYSMKNNMLHEVNYSTLLLLEYYLKDKISDLSLKFPHKQNEINIFLSFINKLTNIEGEKHV